MKKLLIISFVIVSSFLQSKWVEIPYTGQFTLEDAKLAAGNKDNIWAVASKRLGKGKEGLRDFYLVKWNSQKKRWDNLLLIDKKRPSGFFYDVKLTVAPDGSVFLLKPRELTKKSRVQRNVIEKGDVLAGKKNFNPQFTTFLLRFTDGKFEKVHDFVDEKAKIANIAAVSKNELWLLKEQGKIVKNKAGQEEMRFDMWVEKWNGTSFERMGDNVKGVWHISAGSDGSVYLSGADLKKFTLLKWNGSAWKPIILKSKKSLKALDSTSDVIPQLEGLAVAGDKEIWFHLSYPAGTVFYRWTGTFLEEKGMIKAEPGKMAIGVDVAAVPGLVLASDHATGKLYKWFEPTKKPKPKMGINPVRPVFLPAKK